MGKIPEAFTAIFAERDKFFTQYAQSHPEVVLSENDRLSLLREHEFNLLDKAAEQLLPLVNAIGGKVLVSWEWHIQEQAMEIAQSGKFGKQESEEGFQVGLLYWFANYDETKCSLNNYLAHGIYNCARRVNKMEKDRHKYIVSWDEELAEVISDRTEPSTQIEVLDIARQVITSRPNQKNVERDLLILNHIANGGTYSELYEEHGIPATTGKTFMQSLRENLLKRPDVVADAEAFFGRS